MKGNSASKTNACQLLGTFEYINAINRYQIEFNGTDNIKILSVKITLLDPNGKDDTELKPPAFKGWAIISPEDYVLIVTKKIKNKENYYFTILEFNSDAYDDENFPISQFLAIEGSLPFCSLNPTSDIEQVKNQIAKENFMFFNRLHN
ncbi:hypothetical protein [Nitrosomonas ureae]|uniref:Uncharacterized protein n=1 Tax=Nitrosomonas ureae TaxID=44577 RepID=A0A1H9BVJ2_9PROT|nr:hypothetical protein [Nitrosomonas ureae]SEP92986.1 hypothetical protein SAMN05421510_10111 [Nitrosomonas ureae]